MSIVFPIFNLQSENPMNYSSFTETVHSFIDRATPEMLNHLKEITREYGTKIIVDYINHRDPVENVMQLYKTKVMAYIMKHKIIDMSAFDMYFEQYGEEIIMSRIVDEIIRKIYR